MALTFLGVDPGYSGGIAVVDHNRNAMFSAKMPQTERDIWDLIKDLSGSVTYGVLELVHSMPKQGVRSTFTFGKNYGMLRMALTASDISWEEVTPQKWQKEIGIIRPRGKEMTLTEKKNMHKAKAQQLFPKANKITHATADALLIADYARRQWLRIADNIMEEIKS